MARASREVVRALPLFSNVKAELLDLLIRDASLLNCACFTKLFDEGNQASVLHAVIEGEVELFSGQGEDEATLQIIHPRQTFCLPAVIQNQKYRQSARTLTPARILALPANVIRDLYDRDGSFARGIATALAASYSHTMEALKDLKLRRGDERLANWILQTHYAQGSNGQITLKYPKRTLASELGMTPENLSRSLASFAKHGIFIKGRVLLISDAEALRKWVRCGEPRPEDS